MPDCLDDTTQAAHRAAAPVRGNGRVLDTVERRNPALVEAAVLDEIGNNRRQNGIENVGGRLTKCRDAKTVPKRAGQRIVVVGSCYIGDVGQIEIGLECWIRMRSLTPRGELSLKPAYGGPKRHRRVTIWGSCVSSLLSGPRCAF